MHIALIENFRAVFYTPFYALFALHAYEAEGLDVQRVMSTQPAETMQLLLSGKGDVAWGGPIRLMAANVEADRWFRFRALPAYPSAVPTPQDGARL
jgi:NitT/TauT family transport system substrate-binding protein